MINENTLGKVAIAMSGGVDSSVAASLLKEQGNICAGVTLKLFDAGSNLREEGNLHEEGCFSWSDIEDARKVAARLNMPYYVIDLKSDFEHYVIQKLVNSYLMGETPNPCIDCNRHIKFGALLGKVQELGYDYMATGHYIRKEYDRSAERFLLRKGLDHDKDQSYVLYTLTQRQLSSVLFPLGNLSKTQVRQIAKERGFINANKKDSQDICFVPHGNHVSFMETYTGEKFRTGKFMSLAGDIIGEHKGLPFYTLGQRKGLGLSLPRPGYVVDINPIQNTVTIGEEETLFSREFYARAINLITQKSIDKPIHVKVRVRYHQDEQWAVAEQTEEDELHIIFDKPQRAITPGQAAVLYDGDIVVGGGTIVRREVCARP